KALAALLAAHDDELLPVLHKLLGEKFLRPAALRGLAAFDGPDVPRWIVGLFPSLGAAEERDALNTLASRPSFAKALLDAVAGKRLGAAEGPADVVRQLRSLKTRELHRQIADVWGVVRDTPADKAREMKRYKALVLGPGQVPDLQLGRAVFA